MQRAPKQVSRPPSTDVASAQRLKREPVLRLRLEPRSAALPARGLALLAGALATLRDGLAIAQGHEDVEDLRKRLGKAETRADHTFRPPPIRHLLQRLRQYGREIEAGSWPQVRIAERMLITHSLELAGRRERELRIASVTPSAIELELPERWSDFGESLTIAVDASARLAAGKPYEARKLVHSLLPTAQAPTGDKSTTGAGLLVLGSENVVEALQRLGADAVWIEPPTD